MSESAITACEPVLGPEAVRTIRRRERRRDHRRAAFYSFFKRRRSGARRDIEQGAHSYIDLHEPWVFYIAMGAFLLSVTDAFLTLQLMAIGSEELNPMLDYFLSKDVNLFVGIKFVISAACIMFLVMHKNYLLFNRVSGLQILMASIATYTVLVGYELSMLVVFPLI